MKMRLWYPIGLWALLTSVAMAGPELTGLDDRSAFSAARTALEAEKLAKVELFEAQSFKLVQRDGRAVSLVSGRASAPGAAVGTGLCRGPRRRCRRRPSRAHRRRRRLGSRVVSGRAGPRPHRTAGAAPLTLAVIYDARSPNSSVIEPIVLVLKAGRLNIDPAASRKASLAGATTLRAVRAALRGPRRGG